ncbi:hypothetical protein BDV95DRAFT_567983 [Massariosphaeria phaeospora]|uniref:Uncharacterized protein n=1 Tax=Massariosphaeria phaeospora TaxID=100035 RepID=A0A7C8MF83_9PLEO|nr:hypothetical protein BDV95DRAFT_567983 [Massariosphaeria phaeospora]
MVVLLDLDDDAPDAHGSHEPSFRDMKPLHHSLAATTTTGTEPVEADTVAARPNPNVNGFSAALSCYPIVRQLASQLDLNTLHDLSRTCRQFRANLLEYRNQLVKQTLHCASEAGEAPQRDNASALGAVDFSLGSQLSRLTNLRVGQCARDMVGECQRCGTVVCRNCTIKPPPTPVLRSRHRRLCRTCTKAPLQLLTIARRARSASSSTPSPPASPNIPAAFVGDTSLRAFTAPAFERTPCCCDTMVWLCQPCGQHLRNADTMYVRAWTWRTRYRHYLGGVGTGAGEGNEGVECGRGPYCLATRIVEHEVVDSDTEVLAFTESTNPSPERWRGTSYFAQEIEGIGGVFKMKSKKQVRVGDCVKIYEDEKDRGIQYLEREVAGRLRSWCSWCERVVLGEKDSAELAGTRPPSSGCSSASSDS